MSEIRKLIKLTKNAFCVTLPRKYREVLGLQTGNYVEVSLFDKKTIAIRKQEQMPKI